MQKTTETYSFSPAFMYVMFTFVVYALAYIWRMRTYTKKKGEKMNVFH